jgi:hypothetical protein
LFADQIAYLFDGNQIPVDSKINQVLDLLRCDLRQRFQQLPGCGVDIDLTGSGPRCAAE